jgi:hypothetical protein
MHRGPALRHGLRRLDWELRAHEATSTGALLLRYDRRGR